MLGLVLLVSSLGCEPPCVPVGRHDFFLLDGCGGSESGTLDFASSTAATLTTGARTLDCRVEARDDRGYPINACQIGIQCQPRDCSDCPTLRLFSLSRPMGDGVISGSIGSGSSCPATFAAVPEKR